MRLPIQTMYAFLASAATYIAFLPGPAQQYLLRVLEEEKKIVRRRIEPEMALAVAVFIMWLLIHRFLVRAPNSPRAPPPTFVTPAAVDKELKNAKNTNKANRAYVHLFVENIILKAISKEFSERLEKQRRSLQGYSTLMRRLVRTGGTKDADIRELRSQIAKMTKENDELRTRVVLAATSYRNIAEGVALLDQEIGDLQKQNEEFRKRIQWLHHKSRRNNFALKEKRTQIPELQSQVLQKNQNLARARQEAAAKNALVASLRNQVNTLSRLSLLPTEIQSP